MCSAGRRPPPRGRPAASAWPSGTSGQELASATSALERPRIWERLAIEATMPDGASAGDDEIQAGMVDPRPGCELAVDEVIVETGVASGA